MQTSPDSMDHGYLTHAMTGRGKSPAVFRSIRDCNARIQELCQKLDIPPTDMGRSRVATYASDRALRAVSTDPSLEDPNVLEHLKSIRRELLLHELAMRGEASFDMTEPEGQSQERMRKHARVAGETPEPLARFLKALV